MRLTGTPHNCRALSYVLVLLAPLATRSAPGQTIFALKSLPVAAGVSSSLPADAEQSGREAGGVPMDHFSAGRDAGRSLLHGLGFDMHLGINGIGGDVALPIARRLNVRVGGEYFRYNMQFTEEGADVTAALRLGTGRVALDWFPFNNGFRISPLMAFGIRTRVDATVLVPSGRQISLNGQDYVSSDADPLHGSAVIQTRKTAPGLTVGWGNIAPHGNRHLSFPVDVGFYYIGQPDLTGTFKGSACDPAYPQPLGCQEVTSDAGFQRDIGAFFRRNENNLSYASFFPVISTGVGYRF